jgi:hypothetical protein
METVNQVSAVDGESHMHTGDRDRFHADPEKRLLAGSVSGEHVSLSIQAIDSDDRQRPVVERPRSSDVADAKRYMIDHPSLQPDAVPVRFGAVSRSQSGPITRQLFGRRCAMVATHPRRSTPPERLREFPVHLPLRKAKLAQITLIQQGEPPPLSDP